jgi:serine protease
VSLTFKPGAAGARTGSVSVVSNGTGSPQVFSVNGTGTAGTSTSTVTVVEYHNSDFDHYFITPAAAEIALLDAHAPPFQAWSRTGLSFNGYVTATAPATSVAICRFFNSTFAPKSSHFYAPHGLGCEATIAGFPDWKLEDDKLFNATLPDAAGACTAGTIPVYRLYNSGMGGAPNHRFVASLTERQNMINQGFIAEGNGIGVGMCVPP